MIDEANGEADPVLSNLKITLAHRELARRLREVTGEDAGVNFHSWAVWGSKKAGVTVRQEDLEDALANATKVSGAVGAVLGMLAAAVTTVSLALATLASGTGIALLLVGATLGAVVGALVGRAIARYSRREASRQVLEGNRLVLDDIGRQTARFVENFAPGEPIDDDALQTFLLGMDPRSAERGGQALLKQAFTHYAEATRLKDPRRKQQAVYFANLLAILNEHIKLQPYIAGSMPFIVRRCVTERMLTFDIGPLALAVAEDVPSLDDHVYPPSLVELIDPDLQDFLGTWDRSQGSPVGSRASDWSQIGDRMGYIVHLFRCFHVDDAVDAAPYDAEQVRAIEAGRVPAGPL